MMSQPFPSCEKNHFNQNKSAMGALERSPGATVCSTSPTKRPSFMKRFWIEKNASIQDTFLT
jgi:hypothetical protein